VPGSGVKGERIGADSRVLLPVVLVTSAALPLAVLRLPSVLLYSALSPVAVFRSPVVLNKSA